MANGDNELEAVDLAEALAALRPKKEVVSKHKPGDIANVLQILGGGGMPDIGLSKLEPTPVEQEAPVAPVVIDVPAPSVHQLIGTPEVQTPTSFGKIPNIPMEAISGVTDPSTLSIEQLTDIASSLAPGVETTPIDASQLIGADLFGLTPQEVLGVASTKTAQRAQKASEDATKLDFLRASTGQKQAEKLVSSKISEDVAIGKQKFAKESAEAEAAKSRNLQATIANKRNQTTMAQEFLRGRFEAAKAAAGPQTAVDREKEARAAFRLEVAKTKPYLAWGYTHIPDASESVDKLETDKQLTKSGLGMSEEERQFHLRNISIATPEEEI